MATGFIRNTLKIGRCDAVTRRNQDAINRILADAGVPQVSDMGTEVMEITN